MKNQRVSKYAANFFDYISPKYIPNFLCQQIHRHGTYEYKQDYKIVKY